MENFRNIIVSEKDGIEKAKETFKQKLMEYSTFKEKLPDVKQEEETPVPPQNSKDSKAAPKQPEKKPQAKQVKKTKEQEEAELKAQQEEEERRKQPIIIPPLFNVDDLKEISEFVIRGFVKLKQT